MNPRDHLNEYVKLCGGRPAAAERLGIPYPTLCSICNGYRGVSPATAEKMEKRSKGMLDRQKLVWIRATKKEGSSANQEAV